MSFYDVFMNISDTFIARLLIFRLKFLSPRTYKLSIPLKKGLSSVKKNLFAQISKKSSYETSKNHES